MLFQPLLCLHGHVGITASGSTRATVAEPKATLPGPMSSRGLGRSSGEGEAWCEHDAACGIGHAQCWEEMGTGPIARALSGLTTCIMGVQSSPTQGAGARGRGFWHLDHVLEVAQTVLGSSHVTGFQGRPDAQCPHCGCKRTC